MKRLLRCGLVCVALAVAGVCWAAPPVAATPEGCRALRLHGRRISVDAAENGREHARGEAELSHGKHHETVPGHGLRGG